MDPVKQPAFEDLIKFLALEEHLGRADTALLSQPSFTKITANVALSHSCTRAGAAHPYDAHPVRAPERPLFMPQV